MSRVPRSSSVLGSAVTIPRKPTYTPGLCGCQRNDDLCRRKMRMSGLCKVEMSAFLRAGGPYGRGADRVECEGAGAVEGVARDPTRTFAADRWRTPIATERSSGAAFTAACAQRRRWRAGAWAARPSLEPQAG